MVRQAHHDTNIEYMKLLYIANIRFPTEKAHGLQIAKMCEAFTVAGAEVTLVMPTRKNYRLGTVDPLEYYGIKQRFTIRRLSVPDPYWLINVASGLYIKVQSALFIVRLMWFLRSISADTVIFTRDEYLLPILQRYSRHVVWEAHTLPKNIKRYRRPFALCHRIVSITVFLKDELAKLGINKEKILVAPDGVDVEQFNVKESVSACREELGLPLDKKIVLYSGHLYNWKGVYTLAEASKMLDENTLTVFVGGTAGDKARLVSFIKKNNLNNTLIVGYRPPREVPLYLHAADILVLPNSAKKEISSHFTSPLKLFEYLASGKPIIASDLPSLREILNDSNAHFATPDDVEKLASSINYALKDTKGSAHRAQQARQDAKKYSWLERAKSILQYINY